MLDDMEQRPWSQTDSDRSSEVQQDPSPWSTEGIERERLQGIKDMLELEKLSEQRKTMHTEEERAQAWSEAAKAAETYSDNMIHRWNKEIDVYLVFAALFSAILTGFNVESYKLLQPSSLDSIAVSLQNISMQLHGFPTSSTFLIPAHSALSNVASDSVDASTPRYAIKLNTLWFSSLILSLASTVIGILAKQWIGEYNNGLTGTSRGAARLRQYRLNNLVKWHVGHIIALIPILLLIALGLFLAGLLILLWELHPTVARVASVLVAVVAVSTTMVTLLPLFTSDCSYHSPQTRLLLFLWQRAIYPALWVVLYPFAIILWFIATNTGMNPLSSTGAGQQIVEKLEKWIGQVPWTSTGRSTWRGYERSVVKRLSSTLDIDMLVHWYDSTLNVHAVSSAAICLLDQGADFVLDYFTRLDDAVGRHFSAVGISSASPKSDLLVWQVVLCAVNMGTMGLLQKPRRIPLYSRIRDYHLHPPSLEDPSSIDRMACAIAAAALGNELRPGSDSYPIKEVAEVLNKRLKEMRSIKKPTKDVIVPSRAYSVADLSEGALLQQHMSRCLGIAKIPPEALRSLGHATDRDYSIARLNYLSTADQYLCHAARVLSAPVNSSTTATAQITTTKHNTLKVLKDLYDLLFTDLFEGGDQADLRHGCNDYHTLIRNVVNTFNTYHRIFKPLFRTPESPWKINSSLVGFDDLRQCLEQCKKRPPKHAVIIRAHLRYSTTLKDAIDQYRKLYENPKTAVPSSLSFPPVSGSS